MEIKTVTAVGSGWKPVKCEKCDHLFEYQMTRTGAASMTDVLDPSGSGRDGLADAASYELEYKLKSETELMPCPVCGTYQSDMIHPMEIHPGWVAGGLALAAVILLALIDLALGDVAVPAILGLVLVVGVAGGSYKWASGFLARRWEQAYQGTYARLNKDLERNKQRAAAFREKGLLRDRE